MQALRFDSYGDPSILKIEEVARPQLQKGEVLVKVSAAGINRSDVGIVAGAFHSKLPRTPGRDFAGTIIEGADTGLRVWGSGAGFGIDRDGGHAELVAVPRSWLTSVPANLSPAQAAAAGVPFIVAFVALDEIGRLEADETLLVTGSEGAVGRAAIQIAHWRKARVIGAQLCNRRGGADAVIDTSKEDLAEAVKALTAGVGVDLALDTVGGDLFEPVLRSLAQGGRHLVIGSAGRRRVELDLVDFYHRAAALYGVDSMGFSGEHSAAVLARLRLGFESGALEVLPHAELPFARAVEAYETVQRGARDRQVLVFR